MRRSNHSSLADGIPDAKLQGSEASRRKNLRFQTRYCAENRFVFNRLAVVHGRLSIHCARVAHGPFILIDMENGRPTEGGHTIGDMVARAARSGVSAPLLTAARCNLQAYEISRTKGPL